MTGRLIIFEGPDGTGKTTLSRRLVEWLTAQGRQSRYISFPGREEGTLGNLVYAVHHKPAQFGVHRVEPTARQLLHVAAHIDSFHTTIGPALEAGEVIVMDRFWWSTVVYGRAAGVDDKSIQLMIDLEKHHWAGCRPSVLFLLDRTTAAPLDCGCIGSARCKPV